MYTVIVGVALAICFYILLKYRMKGRTVKLNPWEKTQNILTMMMGAGLGYFILERLEYPRLVAYALILISAVVGCFVVAPHLAKHE